MRALFVEGLLEQPDDNREVLAFVVGGQDDGVLVLGGCHFGDLYFPRC